MKTVIFWHPYFYFISFLLCFTLQMKQSVNPITLISKKDIFRIVKTLFKVNLLANNSFLHIWCMWSAHAHASTRATILMHVKNSMHYFCLLSMKLIVWDIGMKKKWNKDQKNLNWITDHFSLISVILSFAWMLYFHRLHDFRIREEFKV